MALTILKSSSSQTMSTKIHSFILKHHHEPCQWANIVRVVVVVHVSLRIEQLQLSSQLTPATFMVGLINNSTMAHLHWTLDTFMAIGWAARWLAGLELAGGAPMKASVAQVLAVSSSGNKSLQPLPASFTTGIQIMLVTSCCPSVCWPIGWHQHNSAPFRVTEPVSWLERAANKCSFMAHANSIWAPAPLESESSARRQTTNECLRARQRQNSGA